jgi:hypothetical protein
MVIFCSRSAARPSNSSEKSSSPPWVPNLRESLSERVKLILEQLLRFVQQTPEQCRLAVVDRSAGDESQQTRARLSLQQRGEFIIDDLRLGIHQK